MHGLPTINRFAVTLIPTKACLEWINCYANGGATTRAEVQREPTVYLIPQGEANPESYIRGHYRAVFEEELNSWYADPEMWPKDLSFETFNRFFTIHVSSMVFDLGSGAIVKED